MKTSLAWVDQFYHDFSSLSVLDAMDILCVSLDCGGMFWKRGGKLEPITDIYCDGNLFDVSALRLHGSWLGGPPDNIRWRTGSLLALVVDRCVLAMVRDQSAKVCNAIKLAEKYGCYKLQIEPISS